MYKTLNPGVIGVKAANLDEALAWAKRGRFEGLEVDSREIRKLVDEQGVEAVRSKFEKAGIRPGVFVLPINWRGSEEEMKNGLAELDALANACSSIGCTRTFIWIGPSSNELTLEENRKFHIDRFKPVAEVLAKNGCTFGLEFIGPKTSRGGKHPFYYKMQDMLELGRSIGPNVRLLVDSWHWYTSGGTVAELESLDGSDVVFVHVNDAPAGVDRDEQIDNIRCLPAETGVIDIEGFMKALKKIGYDGPVVCEPFNKGLTELASDEDRIRVVADSMDKIFKYV